MEKTLTVTGTPTGGDPVPSVYLAIIVDGVKYAEKTVDASQVVLNRSESLQAKYSIPGTHVARGVMVLSNIHGTFPLETSEKNFTVSLPMLLNLIGPSPRYPKVGDQVGFEVEILQGGTLPFAFNWSFGDGQTSSVQNPVWIPATEGTYLVTVIVTDTDGQSQNIGIYVNVQPAGSQPPPAPPQYGDLSITNIQATGSAGVIHAGATFKNNRSDIELNVQAYLQIKHSNSLVVETLQGSVITIPKNSETPLTWTVNVPAGDTYLVQFFGWDPVTSAALGQQQQTTLSV